MNSKNMSMKKMIALGVGVAFALLVVFSSFFIINPSERGVVVTLGKMQDNVVPPGIHLKMPFISSVQRVSIRPIAIKMEIPVNDDGAITRDNQIIGGNLTYFYQFTDTKIVDMLKQYGTKKIDELSTVSLTEAFKTAIGKYTIFDVATTQEKIRKETFDYMVKKMEAFPVKATDLTISNYNWSPEFDKQITLTMQRAQEVKQKEQELLIATAEAQKKVKVQEADTSAAKLKADAEKYAEIAKAEALKQKTILEAEAKVKEGEALKKYNDLVRTNLDIEIRFRELEIAKIRAENWDGREVADNKIMPFPINGVAPLK